MKKLILLTLLALIQFGVSAQDNLKFRVTNFEMDQFDLSATDPGYEKRDGNGDRYAIIKITSTTPDDKLNEYRFDFGNMRHEVAEHNGILWVYVQKNAKYVTISRPGYNTINRYDLNTTIAPGKCYKMTISAEAPVVYTQMVNFRTVPPVQNAAVMIRGILDDNEKMLGVTNRDGELAAPLEYGTYTYRIVTTDYYPSEGRIVLNNMNELHNEVVQLRSNFGTITLEADPGTDIYVNNEKRGTGRWSGRLPAGTYTVESVKPNHRNSRENITVTENETKVIKLKAPEAITGTLSVVSSPSGASILIDGKVYGITPKLVTDLLVGTHTLQLVKEGYIDEKLTVTIREGQMETVNRIIGEASTNTPKTNAPVQTPSVPDDGTVRFTSTPSGANLYINDNYLGTTPQNVYVADGQNNIRLSLPGYNGYNKNENFDSSVRSRHYTLKSLVDDNRYKKFYGYSEGGLYLGNAISPYVGIGTYIQRFNLEIQLMTDLLGDDWMLSGICIKGGIDILHINNLRFTPQFGYFINFDDDAYSDFMFGLKSELSLTKKIGFTFGFQYVLNCDYDPKCCATMGLNYRF